MWEQIRANRIKAVILAIGLGGLLLVLGYILGLYFFENPTGGLIIALAVWGIMNLVGFFQGDSILLTMSKAKKIIRDDHPRLYNIVEEMKIASGLEKMPDIYIIDDPALNAFATGRDPNKASVAITSGLLQKLNRDELQGVIGHELAHIKNRDVMLMAMAGVLLGTIVILSWFGTRALFFGGGRRSNRGSGGGQLEIIILVLAIALMILAPIFAQLLYFAISRKREYLADASSALYTRYPAGLASALEKLADSTVPVKSANKATAPMYIINPFREKGLRARDLTSTHPPISERVRILRSMGGASFTDYNQSYKQVKGSGVMSASTMSLAGGVGIRQPSGKEKPEEALKNKITRTRETSDLMWKMNDYRTIACDCGTKLKIPPAFKGKKVRCPHCGRMNKTN